MRAVLSEGDAEVPALGGRFAVGRGRAAEGALDGGHASPPPPSCAPPPPGAIGPDLSPFPRTSDFRLVLTQPLLRGFGPNASFYDLRTSRRSREAPGAPVRAGPPAPGRGGDAGVLPGHPAAAAHGGGAPEPGAQREPAPRLRGPARGGPGQQARRLPRGAAGLAGPGVDGARGDLAGGGAGALPHPARPLARRSPAAGAGHGAGGRRRTTVEPLEVLTQRALENRLDLLETRDEVGDARRTSSLARQNLLPQLDLNVGVSQFGTGTSFGNAFTHRRSPRERVPQHLLCPGALDGGGQQRGGPARRRRPASAPTGSGSSTWRRRSGRPCASCSASARASSSRRRGSRWRSSSAGWPPCATSAGWPPTSTWWTRRAAWCWRAARWSAS